MTVGELIAMLRKEDADKVVLMFADEEGNTYADDISIELYEGGYVVLVPNNAKDTLDLEP